MRVWLLFSSIKVNPGQLLHEGGSQLFKNKKCKQKTLQEGYNTENEEMEIHDNK